MKSLLFFGLIVCGAVAISNDLCAASATRETAAPMSRKIPAWQTLKSRSGWSIEYPSSWVPWSCMNCPDPTALDVYVSFGEPSSTGGFVMVQPLEDRPPGQNTSQWLDEVKRTANLNPIERERSVSLNGLPGLRVRYKSSAPPIEMDVTYLVAKSKTFSITFSTDMADVRLDDLPNYAVYERMLKTFRVALP